MSFTRSVIIASPRCFNLSADERTSAYIAKLVELREKFGPDSVMFLGSAKVSNEQGYYIRKFVSMFGTNNIDHQARI